MRVSVLSSLAAVSLVGVLACNGEPLTGPNAQAAYSQAVATHPAVMSYAIYVDGRRLPPDKGMPRLDPKTISRIEVLKGEAAVKLYGPAGQNGVIRIYTMRAAKPAVPGER